MNLAKIIDHLTKALQLVEGEDLFIMSLTDRAHLLALIERLKNKQAKLKAPR